MNMSLKNLGLAGAAMALALTPSLVAAQDQTMPPSMPNTGTTTMPPANPTGTPAPTDPAMPQDSMPNDTMPKDTMPSDTMPQDTMPAPTDGTTMDPADPATGTPDRTASRTISPQEQETAMASWPEETRTYYKSLDTERQEMFWALTDTDKVRLSQLPEDQREAAWGQIKAQIKGSQG